MIDPEEDYREKNEENALLYDILLKSKMLDLEQIDSCFRQVEKEIVTRGTVPSLLKIIESKGLLNAQDLKSLRSKLNRSARDEHSEQYNVKGYHLLRKIGEGDLGAVFQARQISMRRTVAIKVLHPKWANDSEFRKRFRFEARILGRLSHQNLVNIHDTGRSGDVEYIAMEYIDGPSVSKLIRESGSMSTLQALDIVLQVGRAINYLEKFDIVHRDIKPANILLTRSGLAKLGDFGFIQTKRTNEIFGDKGFVIGTPSYISPEQAAGHTVDFRSDIYSLGITLYHMLTGELPYQGSVNTVLDLQTNAPLPPQTTMKGEKVPDEIYSVICKMVAKDPNERYQKIVDLLDDLSYLKASQIVKKHDHLNAPSKTPAPPVEETASVSFLHAFFQLPTPFQILFISSFVLNFLLILILLFIG